ncbi:MAG: hypothetical protein HY923_05045 [Elusimicrobia bacterium]|nr:hypothetical protein [Elusimicrobiota bacterium]
MKKALAFGRMFIVSPSRAAEACSEHGALRDALVVYGLTLLGAAVFQYWKPFDFPDANAAVPLGTQDFLFWLKVMLWQPLLMAFLIGFTGALLHWMKDGWLPLKLFTSFFWSVIPWIFIVLYLPREHAPSIINGFQFRVLFTLWILPTIYAMKRVPSDWWRPLAAFLLVMNVIQLLTYVPEAVVTMLRWETGYKAVVGGAGLWMLFAGAFGLKKLPPGRPLPRALLPLLFALLLQIVVVIAAFMLGWLPKETLKALLYG